MSSFSCALKCKLQPVDCLTLIGTEGFARSKVRYRGIGKNMCRFRLLLGFANPLRCGQGSVPT